MSTVHVLRFDDGNNHYGDVEVVSTKLEDVLKYVLQYSSTTLDGTDFGSFEYDVDENWRPSPVEDSVTEIVLREYTPSSGTRRSSRRYSYKYNGPRDLDHLYEMIEWLEEFSDDRYTLTSHEVDGVTEK